MTAPGRPRTVSSIVGVAVALAVILPVTLTGGSTPTSHHAPPVARSTTTSQPSPGSSSTASGASVAADDFGRVVNRGWGTAPVGGPWSLVKGSASDLSVNGAGGVISVSAGSYLSVDHVLVLPSTSIRDFLGTFDVSFTENINHLNPQYGGVVAYLVARFQNTSANGYYRLGVVWDAATRRLWLRTQNPAGKGHPGDFTIETNTGIDPAADFPGPPYGPYHVKVEIRGSGPTRFASKIWRAGTPEASVWMLAGNDPHNLGPQGPGPVGVRASNDLQVSPGSYLKFTAHLVISHLVIRPSGT
jgi:hypothetical protein